MPENNVTPITDRQPAPACHFSITAMLDGFPITIEGEGRAADLRVIVDRLKQIGAEPPAVSKPEPTKTGDIPRCPIHNAPMKPSRKPGRFYCAKKAEDGEYCREVA